MGSFLFSLELLSASVVFVEGVFGDGGSLIRCGFCLDVEAVWVMRLAVVFGIEGALLGEGPMVAGVSGLHFISIYY
jgi:hypothetical protein